MNEHDYSTDQLRELAARMMADNPDYLDMDKVGGMRWFLALCTRLGDGEHLDENGKAWLEVWQFIARNHPGLIDRTPSPDNLLKRGRDVRKDMREKGWVRPPIGHYWKPPTRSTQPPQQQIVS